MKLRFKKTSYNFTGEIMGSSPETNSTELHSDKTKLMSMSLLTNRAILVVLSSNFLGKTFIIDKDEAVVGRLNECDISLDDPAISKNHCKIIFDKDNKFYIEDIRIKKFDLFKRQRIEEKNSYNLWR